MKDTATVEEMWQEALSRLEIFVKHGVSEKVVNDFEKGRLWAYHRYEKETFLEGMTPADPFAIQTMKQMDDGSKGTFLTYCVCYLHQDKQDNDPIPCQITVSSDRNNWTNERQYLYQTCSYLTPMDDDTVSEYADKADFFYDLIDALTPPDCPVYVAPYMKQAG